MNASEPAGRLLLLARRLGAAAALILLGAAVASALGSRAAAAGTEPTPAAAPAAPATPAAPGEPPAAPPEPTAAARASPCDRASPGAIVHLNQASSEQLQQLPGIGPAKAARILEHRRRHGPFRRLRDLRRVKGIGARTLQRLAPLLSLDPPPSSSPAGNVHDGR